MPRDDAQSLGAGNVVFIGTRIINSALNANTLTIDGTDDVSFNGITNTNTLNISGGTLQGSSDITVTGLTSWSVNAAAVCLIMGMDPTTIGRQTRQIAF